MADEPIIDICGEDPLADARRSMLYDCLFPQQTITNSVTLSQSDHDTVWVNTDGGNVSVTLPSPSIVLTKEFTIKKVNVGGGTCAVIGEMDDFTDMTLDDFASITVKSIGTQWMIVSSHRFNIF